MASLNYTPLRIIKKNNNKNIAILAFLGLSIIVVASLIFFEIRNINANGVDTKPQSVGAQATSTPTPTQVPSKPSLSEVVQTITDVADGEYAVAIKNLKTGESYYARENQELLSASLYKLWVMGTVYQAIEEEKITEEIYMKRDVVSLNEKFKIATDDAQIKEGTVEMNVGQALTKMITLSDNYSALLLTDRVGTKAVRLFLESKGLLESDVTQIFPTTTANDIALFFEKLYLGELGSEISSEKMIELLKNQEIVDILPKNLPEETIIAHKTGLFPPYVHDAGIIYAGGGEYIIVLLGKYKDTNVAKDVMARISEAVFVHFNTRDSIESSP